MTAKTDFEHGTSAYSNYGCRCEVCRSAWSAYTRKRRVERRAQREEVDGRMVATYLPPEGHGTESAYSNHACRCEACTEAQRLGAARRAARIKEEEQS